MGAAKYVGRIGGLAVALGVGVAILTGQGAASASTGSGGEQSGKASSAESAAEAAAGAGTTASGSAASKAMAPRRAGTAARVPATAATPEYAAAKSKGKRASDAMQKQLTEVKKTVDGASVGLAPAATKVLRSQESATSAAPPVSVDEDTDGADTSAAQQLSIASAQPSTPVSATVTRVLAAVVGEVLTPMSDSHPVLPIGGAPGDLLLLAGTRRESSAAAVAADAPSYDIAVTAGVIGGCVLSGCPTTSGAGLPVTYTVVIAPSGGGKVRVSGATGAFNLLPYTDPDSTPSGQETFTVFVAERTPFDAFVTGLPLVGSTLFAPVIMALQQLPVISVVLAPVIGSASRYMVTADVDALIQQNGGAPIAYTTMVTSFDGTQISTNFFPAIGPDLDAATDPGYETILNGPGLGQAGATSPTDPFVASFRAAGYNVVTWDPRGEYASGGVLQLDSPQFEGRDVSGLISWVATRPGVELDSAATATTPGDPRMGMVGVSYGGGIQLVTAANDKRVDAIAPGWAWNSLPDSLYPNEAFKTSYGSLLLLSLVMSGARINNQIYGGILVGDLLGVLTQSQLALLASSGPAFTVRDIEAPTLLIQGTVDVLFPLEQSVINAGYLTTPYFAGDPTATTKLIWFCGGHGACLTGQGDGAADTAWALGEALAWMGRYVKEDGSTDDTVFEWTDQIGTHWSSDTLPSDPNFYSSDVISTTGTGQPLAIVPIFGGSGPQGLVPFPYSLGEAAVARNAITIPLTNPVAGQDPPAHVNVVGAPTITMTYSGLGTSRHVYAQIVDNKTGLVVGNLVTPIPVTLDGRQHEMTVPVALEYIAYTLYPDSSLSLQIATSATPYLNLTEYGFINVSSVAVDLPIAGNAVQAAAAVSNAQLVAV